MDKTFVCWRRVTITKKVNGAQAFVRPKTNTFLWSVTFASMIACWRDSWKEMQTRLNNLATLSVCDTYYVGRSLNAFFYMGRFKCVWGTGFFGFRVMLIISEATIDISKTRMSAFRTWWESTPVRGVRIPVHWPNLVRTQCRGRDYKICR